MYRAVPLCLLAIPALAVQITFTGGNVVFNGGGTGTTNNSNLHSNVDYYEEGGFRLDFIGGEGNASTGFVGNYYGAAANDVIHGHWLSGGIGGLTMIRVSRIDGNAFDLNYFVLTSNTDTGGGPASGLEQTFIHASTDGVNSSFSQLLPPENWGFPATQVFLGSQFDGIRAFWFVTGNAVDCFGMDNFFIDEEAPGVPEPGTFVLIGLGLAGLALRLRKS